MALFKCKACGGDIIPNEDKYTGKCEYCGTIQTLPKDKDEKINQLLNRANDYRLHYDFDRAIFEYEKVLELDETEPEAHWGLFLSKYGVDYVKDTMTQIYKPTLRRISSVSVYDDMDYQATLKYCSFVAAEQYKKDADEIEQVMKELLYSSVNEEPYDIFLSYKELDDVTRQRTDDSYLAHDLYNVLTAEGYKVFFAPKSLVGAKLFEPKIYSAIISAKVMIVLGTKPEYLEGVWVKNEWSRFAELIEKGEDKMIIPVFKNMQASQLPNRIAKYQAYDMTSMTFLEDIKKVIALAVKKKSNVSFDKNASAEAAFIERGFIALEDRDFTKADSFFENALNLNPHNSQAYFGKLMVEMRISKQEQILTSSKPLKEYANFEKAVRFADQQLKVTLLQYEEKVQYTLDEQKYNKAMAFINKTSPSLSDYNNAIDIFKSIHSFKDSKGKEEFCLEKIALLKKDAILQKGIDKENFADGKKENYQEAIELFKTIPGWKDADERIVNCEKKMEEILLVEKKTARKKKRRKRKRKLVLAVVVIFIISVVTVGISSYPRIVFNFSDKILLKSDGTVIGTGDYGPGGYDDVSGWTDIEVISVGIWQTIGLKSDGTVVAVGNNHYGECNVFDWEDIEAVSAGNMHTVGLKSDGTVIAVGDNRFGECDVSDWTDITAISADYKRTVGLKSDSTVVITGDFTDNEYEEIQGWTNIKAVAVENDFTVGLKSDGTIVYAGEDGLGRYDKEEWTDIVAISTCYDRIVGLKADGTVVAYGTSYANVSDWTDIVYVSVSNHDTMGLKSDGTIVYVGNNVKYECDDYIGKDIVSIYFDDFNFDLFKPQFFKTLIDSIEFPSGNGKIIY